MTSFKRVALLGKGMCSDALGSKMVKEASNPRVDRCREGGRAILALPAGGVEPGLTQHCGASWCPGRGLWRRTAVLGEHS